MSDFFMGDYCCYFCIAFCYEKSLLRQIEALRVQLNFRYNFMFLLKYVGNTRKEFFLPQQVFV